MNGERTLSVEMAKKMARTFGVTLDYLVNETGVVAEVTSKDMLERITEIDHLDQEDRRTIIHVIDSLLRDAKAKKPIAPTHKEERYGNRGNKKYNSHYH